MTLVKHSMEDSKYPYKISTAQYSEREELFFCKVGIPSKKEGIELHYYVWGKTSVLCQERALWLAKLLTPKESKTIIQSIKDRWNKGFFGDKHYGQ